MNSTLIKKIVSILLFLAIVFGAYSLVRDYEGNRQFSEVYSDEEASMSSEERADVIVDSEVKHVTNEISLSDVQERISYFWIDDRYVLSFREATADEKSDYLDMLDSLSINSSGSYCNQRSWQEAIDCYAVSVARHVPKEGRIDFGTGCYSLPMKNGENKEYCIEGYGKESHDWFTESRVGCYDRLLKYVEGQGYYFSWTSCIEEGGVFLIDEYHGNRYHMENRHRPSLSADGKYALIPYEVAYGDEYYGLRLYENDQYNLIVEQKIHGEYESGEFWRSSTSIEFATWIGSNTFAFPINCRREGGDACFHATDFDDNVVIVVGEVTPDLVGN